MELRGKANTGDVRACVLRTHIQQAITALGQALDTKASDASVRDAQADLKARTTRSLAYI